MNLLKMGFFDGELSHDFEISYLRFSINMSPFAPTHQLI